MKGASISNTYKVIKYHKDYYDEWNGFLDKSKNGTFLFHRDFMEYHSDRFEDYSLMVYENNKLMALLPANRKGNTIYSHQGLTYGGMVITNSSKLSKTLKAFKVILCSLQLGGFKYLTIKCLPVIYNKIPSDELSFFMFVLKAKLEERCLNSVIKLNQIISYSTSRLEGVKRAKKHNLDIKEDRGFEAFWNEILIPNLNQKHKAKPVHTLAEMIFLKNRFPENIRQFNVYMDNQIVAGATIFITDEVVKLQYISANKSKNIIGSLDYLLKHLIENVFQEKVYFDLGTSKHTIGEAINKGLLFWKEGFEARTVTSDVYKISTDNYQLLNTVLV